MGNPETTEGDPELQHWRRLYPDAYRAKDGRIYSPAWNALRTERVLDEPRIARQIADTKQDSQRKRRRGKRPGPVRTNEDWERSIAFEQRIPGAEITIEPIKEGRGRGWSIIERLRGVGIAHRWPCGCRDVDGIYYPCGKRDACEAG